MWIQSPSRADISPRQTPCVDPARCAECPPDRVCAWACEQGWSEFDIVVEQGLESELFSSPRSLPPLAESQALIESFE